MLSIFVNSPCVYHNCLGTQRVNERDYKLMLIMSVYMSLAPICINKSTLKSDFSVSL